MINFRLFQTEFTDDNFKFDENGRKFSKRVENNFSFSPSVFKRLVWGKG